MRRKSRPLLLLLHLPLVAEPAAKILPTLATRRFLRRLIDRGLSVCYGCRNQSGTHSGLNRLIIVIIPFHGDFTQKNDKFCFYDVHFLL